MNTQAFTIEENVAIPARTIPNAGPRESKYPVDNLKEGQAFAVPVDSVKQARQKQSQFSGLAKTRGIKLVTRYFETDSPFASVPAPCLGIWHGGPADKKDDEAANDEAGTPAQEDANADTGNTGEASDAPGADDDVLVL